MEPQQSGRGPQIVIVHIGYAKVVKVTQIRPPRKGLSGYSWKIEQNVLIEIMDNVPRKGQQQVPFGKSHIP